MPKTPLDSNSLEKSSLDKKALDKTSLEKSKIKILLLEGVHPSAVENFKASGYTNIEYHPKALPEAELLKAIEDAYFVGIRSRTQLTEEVFQAAKKLVAVGCFCIGTNQVELYSALSRGIPVFNAPFSNTRSVAELVLGEIILLMRGIPHKSRECHAGGWVKSAEGSYEVRGKTLGIIGYGNIGSQLSVMAEAIGMQVIFYDVESKLGLSNARQVETLNQLLAASDVVSLHVPELESTKWLLGKEELGKMKPGSHLINASRGSVVVIEDLVAVLKSGHLAGAAIDVFPTEPRSNDDEFISPLRGLDNVILTPHIGGSTLEAQANIGKEVSEKLIRYSDNGTTSFAVNFPEVALPAHPGKHRLLHIHKNQPGVLSEVNRVLSENDINVSGQYLQTNEEVGYLVVDVDREYSEQALAALKEVKGTLRCRVLFS